MEQLTATNAVNPHLEPRFQKLQEHRWQLAVFLQAPAHNEIMQRRLAETLDIPKIASHHFSLLPASPDSAAVECQREFAAGCNRALDHFINRLGRFMFTACFGAMLCC